MMENELLRHIFHVCVLFPTDSMASYDNFSGISCFVVADNVGQISHVREREGCSQSKSESESERGGGCSNSGDHSTSSIENRILVQKSK